MLHSTFDGVNTYETWVCDPLVTTPNANAIIRVYIQVQYWYESFRCSSFVVKRVVGVFFFSKGLIYVF